MTERGRPLADELLDRLISTYSAARDPERAGPAAAYMRNQFPFLGLPAPRQEALNRSVTAGLPVPTEDELRTVALACWDLAEREYQYFACGWLRTHVHGLGAKVPVQDLLKNATGKPLSAVSFVRYVESKYLESAQSVAAA